MTLGTGPRRPPGRRLHAGDRRFPLRFASQFESRKRPIDGTHLRRLSSHRTDLGCRAHYRAQATRGRRRASPELIRETSAYLADRVAGRLRKAKLVGRTVTARVRFVHLCSLTRSITRPAATSTTLMLAEVAERLVRSAITDNQGVREITHSVRNTPFSLKCLSQFSGRRSSSGNRPGSEVESRRWGLDRSVDAIRERFGRNSVGFATAVLSGEDRVPEEFRQLAERGPGDSRDWD